MLIQVKFIYLQRPALIKLDVLSLVERRLKVIFSSFIFFFSFLVAFSKSKDKPKEKGQGINERKRGKGRRIFYNEQKGKKNKKKSLTNDVKEAGEKEKSFLEWK